MSAVDRLAAITSASPAYVAATEWVNKQPKELPVDGEDPAIREFSHNGVVCFALAGIGVISVVGRDVRISVWGTPGSLHAAKAKAYLADYFKDVTAAEFVDKTLTEVS